MTATTFSHVTVDVETDAGRSGRSLLVPLDHALWPGARVVWVLAGGAARSPLAQQVPALVERDL